MSLVDHTDIWVISLDVFSDTVLQVEWRTAVQTTASTLVEADLIVDRRVFEYELASPGAFVHAPRFDETHVAVTFSVGGVLTSIGCALEGALNAIGVASFHIAVSINTFIALVTVLSAESNLTIFGARSTIVLSSD